MAVLTGNRDLAEEKGFETIEPEKPLDGDLPSAAAWTALQNSQPIVPFHRLNDPLQAMGVALFHVGAAALQYAIIRDNPSPESGGCSNAERYCWAENDARIAHAVLHRVHSSLAATHPCGPEIRKSCRQANMWLTRERSRAARTLGIDPPPEPSDDLMHGEMDHESRA